MKEAVIHLQIDDGGKDVRLVALEGHNTDIVAAAGLALYTVARRTGESFDELVTLIKMGFGETERV